MGIMKNIPSTDLKRISGWLQLINHGLMILAFFLLGCYLILGTKLNIYVLILIIVLVVYFVGSGNVILSNSFFKVINKKIEAKTIEETNVQLEPIEKKESKLKAIFKKKEPTISNSTANVS